MSYFAEPNHIEYDAWFDENIDPVDLVNYSDEKEFHIRYLKQNQDISEFNDKSIN